MSNTKHTPGPWRVMTKDDNQHITDEYNGVVALDGPRSNAPGFSLTACINIHDARLISCAPEMLEALKRILGVWDAGLSDNLSTEDYNAIRELISKAEQQ